VRRFVELELDLRKVFAEGITIIPSHLLLASIKYGPNTTQELILKAWLTSTLRPYRSHNFTLTARSQVKEASFPRKPRRHL